MSRPWTPEEDKIICEFYPAEGKRCLLRLPGRKSSDSLGNRARELGVSSLRIGLKPKAPVPPDSAQRIFDLKEIQRTATYNGVAWLEAERRLRVLGA